VEAALVKGHRREHGLADHAGVVGDDVQRDARAQAAAEHASLADAQAGQQGQGVTGHRLDRHGPAGAGGPAMALLLHGDDLAALGQQVRQGPG
jgi:hypothetical protein